MNAVVNSETVVPASLESVLATDFGNELPVEYVPLSRLRPSPLNVRRKAPTGIEHLAENIAAKGLLQNLVVHAIKGGRGKQTLFGVCAGQRRLAALQHLVKAGKLKSSYGVAIKVVSEAEALAASLIENHAREAMHAADQCHAFKMLIDEGRSADYIAALFGVSPLTVQRRLKLANVSPRLLEVYREDGISTEQIAALALSDDYAEQEKLWFEAKQSWLRTPHALREAITVSEIAVEGNAWIAFVTLQAYEDAGGIVRRDLFSEQNNGAFIGDVALLQRLVEERLDIVAQQVAAEGWQWVQTRVKSGYGELNGYRHLPSHTRAMSKDEQAEMDHLKQAADAAQAAQEAAREAYWNGGEEVEDQGHYDRLDDAATDATEALDAFGARLEAWTDEQKALAGALVVLNGAGEITITRGLFVAEQATPSADKSSTRDQRPKPVHGEKLCRRLTAHRTAAVQAELIARPDVAMALLLQRMIPSVFQNHYGYQNPTPLEMQLTCSHDKLCREADDMENSRAWQALAGEREKWTKMLPEEYNALLPWLLEAGNGIVPNLFAFCVAATLDSVSNTERVHPASGLLKLLDVDMATYWQPTGESYLNHVTKARISAAVTQAVSAEAAAPLLTMKKDAAAQAAELLLNGTGWLPEALRNQSASTDSTDPDAKVGDEEDGEGEGED